MAALIPSASATGSGTMTLAGPSTNSNQTITIPDATGTMMVSGNMPAFSAYKSGSQSITSATFTKITFDTEEFDTNNNFASNRFTPTVAGYYQISGAFSSEDSTGGITRLICTIYKNGSEFKRGNDLTTGAGLGYMPIVTSLIYFNGTTDYVELYAYLTGIGPAIRGNQQQTWFQGALVRSA